MRKEAFILAIALLLSAAIVSANTAPIIQELENEISVCEGSALSYPFAVTDAEDGTMYFSISPDSPFFIRSVPSETATTNAELYSGNLTKEQANRKYPLTVAVSDEGDLIDSRDITITVLERNNPPTFTHIGVQTLLLTQNLTEQLFVNDLETGANPLNFTFEIFSDLERSNLTITDLGAIQLVPSPEELGIHMATVCVTDSGIDDFEGKIGICSSDVVEETTCQDFQIAIVEVNTPPTILLYNSSFSASTLLTGIDTLKFEVYKFDPEEIIPETYWYVDKELKKIGVGTAEDQFIYTFGCGVFGRHTIEAVVSDGALNDTVSWSVELARTDCTPGMIQQPMIGPLECDELWGCTNWNVCQDLQQSVAIGLISYEDQMQIEQECSSMNLASEECGFHIRSCVEVNSCSTEESKPEEIGACQFISEPSCSDGLLNCHDGSCEFLVDCGGSCDACATCSDNIKNQGEEGVDCGGPCFEKCPVKVLSETEKNIKQYVVVAIFILIALSLVQIMMIVRQKKRLEQPSKRGVKNAQSIN